jgi:hypothetical protein
MNFRVNLSPRQSSGSDNFTRKEKITFNTHSYPRLSEQGRKNTLKTNLQLKFPFIFS